jgi:FAD/FMN-containing dehydrogenase
VTIEPRIGESYAIFANVRNVRFNEMEYQVPREAGPACLREILRTIHGRNLPSWFPIEYRYVAGDDIWLSQFHGRDSASISVHQFYEMDHHNFFAVIEPIFWKYGGRPHWGKLHTLNARQLRPLYPRFDDFLAVREQLDPAGRMLNAHLRSVFGLPG